MGGCAEGSRLNDTLLSHLTQKSGTHLPSCFLSGSQAMRATCYRIPMCKAMRLARSFKRHHSCTTIPLSHFPSPERSDHIAVCFQQSAYLRSDSIHEPTRVYWHRSEFPFFFFFLDRIVCGEMSQWIPVILLSHCEAAGSHGGKLSV